MAWAASDRLRGSPRPRLQRCLSPRADPQLAAATPVTEGRDIQWDTEPKRTDTDRLVAHWETLHQAGDKGEPRSHDVQPGSGHLLAHGAGSQRSWRQRGTQGLLLEGRSGVRAQQ